MNCLRWENKGGVLGRVGGGWVEGVSGVLGAVSWVPLRWVGIGCGGGDLVAEDHAVGDPGCDGGVTALGVRKKVDAHVGVSSMASQKV